MTFAARAACPRHRQKGPTAGPNRGQVIVWPVKAYIGSALDCCPVPETTTATRSLRRRRRNVHREAGNGDRHADPRQDLRGEGPPLYAYVEDEQAGAEAAGLALGVRVPLEGQPARAVERGRDQRRERARRRGAEHSRQPAVGVHHRYRRGQIRVRPRAADENLVQYERQRRRRVRVRDADCCRADLAVGRHAPAELCLPGLREREEKGRALGDSAARPREDLHGLQRVGGRMRGDVPAARHGPEAGQGVGPATRLGRRRRPGDLCGERRAAVGHNMWARRCRFAAAGATAEHEHAQDQRGAPCHAGG